MADETVDDNKNINPANVTVGKPVKGGCCYTCFNESYTLPETASEDISVESTGFVNLGELSSDGYTKSVSLTSNKFTGWHNTLLLSQISEEQNTFKCAFTEVVRVSVLKIRYGKDAVMLDSDGRLVGVNPTTVPDTALPLIFDELLSNEWKMRTVFPRATIDSIDDEPHQQGSLLVYNMTFTAASDSQGRPYYIRYARPDSKSVSA